ncbi:PREDICTED: 3-ketoacyl-CoA synthase 7-like [Ipomoea nil]|uniref:3-ketoacyl-CoA synthase 7-like n=1 Tax=Ipomoea nil TaxID=35883 RepID=UPI000901A12E|nr:PREDICTED: 3-ketoacyl-CoA synthase 7-like [Ipomoea nil]
MPWQPCFYYYYCVFGSHPVYLLDFCCYRPPDHTRVTTAYFVEQGLHCTEPEGFDFHVKSGTRSGISSEAGAPHVMHQLLPDCSLAIPTTMARDIWAVLELPLQRGTQVTRLLHFILFCPTPSITSMVINRFGLRSNVKSFSLCGMGMEAITSNAYLGSVKSMILTNTLFRMGGVAVLLSNKRQDKKRAKYSLKHLVRTHMGEDDDSYHSVFQENDESGHMGVYLSRNLLQVAGKAIRTNISTLAISLMSVVVSQRQ